MMNIITKLASGAAFAFTLLLTGCSSEGIDRNADAIAENTSFSQFGASGETGSTLDDAGPNRFVVLEKLKFEAQPPSVISVLFQATDRYGNALPGLQTSDFTLLEDKQPISENETSLAIVPHQELPFSLRTVIMIDTSSSILPTDLDKIKTAVVALLVDDNGSSRLLPSQEVSIYSFDDTVSLVKSFSSNASSLVDAVNSIQPATSITPTDFYGAVIEGTSLWNDRFDLSQITQGSLIIITDGTDTAAKHTYEDALNAVTGKSVYTLGIGDEVSNEVMASIGTSATFALRNYEQINSALQTIGQQVKNSANSFYYLHYASPKRRAEGDAANSQHEIMLSVTNNANTSSSGTLVDSFNSAEFSNVSAEVVISGPQNMEIQQTATFRATTRWGPSPNTSYLWSLPEENTACAMQQTADSTVRITGLSTGSCNLSVHDQAAGEARGWHTINIVGD